MQIMQEEIFGPLLPVETYDTLDDAIARLNARPHPLALYYFGATPAHRDRVLRETLAGGVTVNDTLWHFAHEELPFGGVGASGIGAYHGERSFLTFTHEKAVFLQPRTAAAKLLYPPYGRDLRQGARVAEAAVAGPCREPTLPGSSRGRVRPGGGLPDRRLRRGRGQREALSCRR